MRLFGIIVAQNFSFGGKNQSKLYRCHTIEALFNVRKITNG